MSIEVRHLTHTYAEGSALSTVALSDVSFSIGEGEEVWPEIMEKLREWKASGAPKIEFLKALCEIEGMYVPRFYEFDYNGDGTIREIRKLYDKAPDHIEKRIIRDMDSAPFPTSPVVPSLTTISP